MKFHAQTVTILCEEQGRMFNGKRHIIQNAFERPGLVHGYFAIFPIIADPAPTKSLAWGVLHLPTQRAIYVGTKKECMRFIALAKELPHDWSGTDADEALLLWRRIRVASESVAPHPRWGKLKYRAYLRWLRRDRKTPGTVRPQSIAAQKQKQWSNES